MARSIKGNIYRSQGIATRAFGIQFRSKLEAEYAYWFHEHNLEWDYADGRFYDFDVCGLKVEVKPESFPHLMQAVKRIEQDIEVVVSLGSPPGMNWATGLTDDERNWIVPLPSFPYSKSIFDKWTEGIEKLLVVQEEPPWIGCDSFYECLCNECDRTMISFGYPDFEQHSAELKLTALVCAGCELMVLNVAKPWWEGMENWREYPINLHLLYRKLLSERD